MRHRRKGRKLGRGPAHQRALLRNLASSFFLTERDAEHEDNRPKVKGRIVTTLEKAKEVRPLVEKCITIAKRALEAQATAEPLGTTAERGSDAWKRWRESPQWRQWAQAIAPVVNARRRVLRLIGDKVAVRVLFGEIAPRFADRAGEIGEVALAVEEDSAVLIELADREIGDRLIRSGRAPADDRPLAIYTKEAGAFQLTGVDARASALGLRLAMSLADARAMQPKLEAVEAEPEEDARTLDNIAAWCERFTPVVVLDPPDGLFLDITGCAHLFGGERAMARDMILRLARQGLQARIGIVESP